MSLEHIIGWSRLQKALYDATEATKPGGGIDIDENACFCANPTQYDWKYVGKRELLIPYNLCAPPLYTILIRNEQTFPQSIPLHWEKRRVWIVKGMLHRGESNLLMRRDFYIDEENWLILLGEGFDSCLRLVKFYITFKKAGGNRGQLGRWYPTSNPLPMSETFL